MENEFEVGKQFGELSLKLDVSTQQIATDLKSMFASIKDLKARVEKLEPVKKSKK